MFTRADDTVDLIDQPDAPPEDRTVLTFRRRINLAQQGALYAADRAVRSAQDGVMTTVQQWMLYLQAYLVAWSGPMVPLDDQGQPLPVRDDLIAGMDYAIPFVHQALEYAEALYIQQFMTPPDAPLPKAPRPTRRTKKR